MVDLVYCLTIHYSIVFCIVFYYYHYFVIIYIYIYIYINWYHYINLRSPGIFCLYSGDIYFSLNFFLSSSFLTVSQLSSFEVFEAFVILSANLLAKILALAFAFFWTTLFEIVLSAFVAEFLAWSRCFWLYLLLNFLLTFFPMLCSYF